jgi:hypothetical protein
MVKEAVVRTEGRRHRKSEAGVNLYRDFLKEKSI